MSSSVAGSLSLVLAFVNPPNTHAPLEAVHDKHTAEPIELAVKANPVGLLVVQFAVAGKLVQPPELLADFLARFLVVPSSFECQAEVLEAGLDVVADVVTDGSACGQNRGWGQCERGGRCEQQGGSRQKAAAPLRA